MRIRAGVVLIENGQVALIERHRAGTHYFVFPGGGVDEGESPDQAAIREMEEETGLRVAVLRELAILHLGQTSLQHYFLAEKIGGEFGNGNGVEMSNLHPDDPAEGTYLPVWMALEELPLYENIYPAQVAVLVIGAVTEGWPLQPLEYYDENHGR